MIKSYSKISILFCFISIIICLFHLGCQKKSPVFDNINEEQVRADVYQLSSEEFQGRETGLPGGSKTADFIQEILLQTGLKPLIPSQHGDNAVTYEQVFNIVGAGPSDIHTRLKFRNDVGNRATPNQDYYYFFNSPNKLDLQSELVFAGYGIEAPEYLYNDFANLDIRGKVVLAFYGEPLQKDSLVFFNGTHSTKYSMDYWKAKKIAEKGGLALILMPSPENADFYSRLLQRRSGPKGNKNFVLLEDNSVPVIYLSSDYTDKLFGDVIRKTFSTEQNRIRNSINEGSKKSVYWSRSGWELPKCQISLTYNNEEIRSCRNIIACLPGSDPELKTEYILIGTHFDHEGVQQGKLFPGADDNASGVAANLNIARAYANLKDNQRPQRSVIFAFWDAEEKGTLGTRFFVNNPIIPLGNIKVVFNMDMIGRDASFNFAALRQPIEEDDAHNKVMIFYSAQAPYLKEDAMKANLSLNLHLLYDPNVFFTSGSDHVNFHSREIPIVYYFTGFHTDYTSPEDTPDKLNYNKLTRITRHIARFTWLLASARNIPAFDRAILSAPEGDFSR